jgi:hypothetical protein
LKIKQGRTSNGATILLLHVVLASHNHHFDPFFFGHDNLRTSDQVPVEFYRKRKDKR